MASCQSPLLVSVADKTDLKTISCLAWMIITVVAILGPAHVNITVALSIADVERSDETINFFESRPTMRPSSFLCGNLIVS